MGCSYSSQAAVHGEEGSENDNHETHQLGFDVNTDNCSASFSSFINSDNPQIFEWLFKEKVWNGVMCSVYLAQNTNTKEIVAAKVYNIDKLLKPTLGERISYLDSVKREVDIISSLDHVYITPIIEFIEDQTLNSLILIMPFAEHGSLKSYFDTFDYTEHDVSVAFLQVAEAMRYIHSRNIVHRDFKPENILAFSMHFYCLADFNVATRLRYPDEYLRDTRGTPAFMAPEEYEEKPFLPKPADVWSFGVSLYSLLFKKLPFGIDQAQYDESNPIYSVSNILSKSDFAIPDCEGVSEDALDLLRRILVRDPLKRLRFDEIIDHPWFNQAREIDELNMLSSNLIDEFEISNSSSSNNKENIE